MSSMTGDRADIITEWNIARQAIGAGVIPRR